MKQGRKVLNLSDVQTIFSQIPKGSDNTMKQECQLLDNNILLAFANSKFLITDEMTHAHNLVTMKVDEFYEFICRIAQVAEFNGNAGWTTPPKEKEKDAEAAEDKNKESLKEIPEEQETSTDNEE